MGHNLSEKEMVKVGKESGHLFTLQLLCWLGVRQRIVNHQKKEIITLRCFRTSIAFTNISYFNNPFQKVGQDPIKEKLFTLCVPFTSYFMRADQCRNHKSSCPIRSGGEWIAKQPVSGGFSTIKKGKDIRESSLNSTGVFAVILLCYWISNVAVICFNPESTQRETPPQLRVSLNEWSK